MFVLLKAPVHAHSIAHKGAGSRGHVHREAESYKGNGSGQDGNPT